MRHERLCQEKQRNPSVLVQYPVPDLKTGPPRYEPRVLQTVQYLQLQTMLSQCSICGFVTIGSYTQAHMAGSERSEWTTWSAVRNGGESPCTCCEGALSGTAAIGPFVVAAAVLHPGPWLSGL